MTKKRSPSGPTGESPEAKKQDSKATPPSQGIQERQGADDANKSVINPKYWYSDGNINTYVTNVIKHKLGGFADDVSGVKCSFLLKNQLGKNNDLYYILYTGAVDSTEMGTPLDFFLDKSKQPEPDAGKSDDRKDVFDELNPLLQKQDRVNAKILLPYNITQTHWLTGEIIIKKTSNAISVIIFAHDPYGRGEVSKENFQILKTALEKRIQEGINDIPPVNITKEQSPYINSRQQDSNSCGVIVADEIVKRMQDEELPLSPYPPGAEELRRLQLDFLREKLGEDDIVYQRFVTEVTKIDTSDRKHDSATKSSSYDSDINEESVQKCHIKEFLSKLFGIDISNETFTDIMIKTNDANHKITVHSSGMVSSSVEQARHITPLMFIKTALKAQTQDTFSKNYLVGNFIDYILAMSNRVQGVCLTQEQYDAYHQQNDPKKVCFNIKVTTIKRDNTKIVKYLIPNESEEYKALPEYNSDETRKDYTMLFRQYIKYVLSGLQKMLLDSHYTLETTCELIAKFILTVFNQEREKCFSTIDNILFKEIHLYKYAREAKIASDAYDSISHKEIIDRVREKEKYLGENKSPYIRIIDIKEMMIQNAVEALRIIDLLTKKNIMLHWDENDVILFESYNKDYNFKIDTFTHDDDTLDNYTNYEDELTRNNYSGIFRYHAAKHLYQIFDFRSLGNEKMFALKQSKDGTRVVKVYPSDNKQLIEQYSIQSSTTAKLTTELKELLTQQAISHSFLILSLFSSLSSHIPLEEDDMSPIGPIFSSFCQLLMADYSLPNTLNQEWYNGLQLQFNTEVINRLSENLDLSGGLYEQDDLNF